MWCHQSTAFAEGASLPSNQTDVARWHALEVKSGKLNCFRPSLSRTPLHLCFLHQSTRLLRMGQESKCDSTWRSTLELQVLGRLNPTLLGLMRPSSPAQHGRCSWMVRGERYQGWRSGGRVCVGVGEKEQLLKCLRAAISTNEVTQFIKVHASRDSHRSFTYFLTWWLSVGFI